MYILAFASYSEGIAIEYSDGTYCSNVGSYRTTVINVACDPTVDDFQIVSESEPSSCNYSLK